MCAPLHASLVKDYVAVQTLHPQNKSGEHAAHAGHIARA
jgi:hypothetical protein